MLEVLRKNNPDITLYSIFDEKFSEYGRVVEGLEVKEIMDAAKNIQNPEAGSAYIAMEELFQTLPIEEEIAYTIFGEMPTQVGYCWGHSKMLNGAEWHTTSELNIAITPLVLFLGKRQNIVERKIDSALFDAFYVPSGTVLEVYATTLHFCPCEVEEGGFGCVVALPSGTNTPLEMEAEDKLLFRKNKWIISHVDNEGLINRGVLPGITGVNWEIKY